MNLTMFPSDHEKAASSGKRKLEYCNSGFLHINVFDFLRKIYIIKCPPFKREVLLELYI